MVIHIDGVGRVKWSAVRGDIVIAILRRLLLEPSIRGTLINKCEEGRRLDDQRRLFFSHKSYILSRYTSLFVTERGEQEANTRNTYIEIIK